MDQTPIRRKDAVLHVLMRYVSLGQNNWGELSVSGAQFETIFYTILYQPWRSPCTPWHYWPDIN